MLSEEPPTPTEAASSGGLRSRLSRWRLPLLGVSALLLVGGGFAGGYLVADDADEVETLEAELSATESELEEAEDDALAAQGQLDDVEAELAEASRESKDLAAQLEAELDFAGKLPASGAGSAPRADYVMGQAGEVGPLNMVPQSFEESGSSGDQTTYTATISVKNNTSDPVDPFCADGAAVIDELGRRYTGESLLRTSSPNCGNSLQPGLTEDGYLMEFKLPTDATPAVLELWGTYDINNEGDAGTWSLSE